MSNPFQEHAQNFADYETMLQGDDASGGATMTIAGKTLPCTHSNIITGFQLVLGGQSANTFIEHVEFLAMNLPANFIPTKGIYFSLKPNPNSAPIALQLWDGGLQQGGFIYRFRACDQNYKA